MDLKSTQYQVKLKEFEGPLDLLLHLVKNSEINIYDISISEITQQYLSYLSLLVTLDLDNIIDFIDMASTLILIKSRSMLPVEIDFEEENEVDLKKELIEKLLEYQKYKIAAGLLEEKSEENIFFNNKNYEQNLFNIEDDVETNWKQLSIIDLLDAFASVLNNNKSQPLIEINLFDYTVEEKIKEINNILLKKDNFNYFEIINNNMPKQELVCIFLAILELVKQGQIKIKQHILFGDIHIFKKNI